MAAKRSTPFFLLFLLLLQAEGIRLGQWGTLMSLSESLMSRVANARAARDDHVAAERAREIAKNIHRFGGGRGIWSAAWDFAWNYGFRGGTPSVEIYRSATDIVAVLAELYSIDSGEERTRWVLRNYPRLMRLSKSLFRALLSSFSRSGVLREAVLVMQKEVVDGELLRDCLEVGAVDLEGLIRVARDMFFSDSSTHGEL
ncbi:hypothetical protein KSP39_PZI005551 [Platanthera zijinensis]|uniref:Uncharacterized protein n=1 Tax=Platanthera zijinensis TaxID=2320716 RepID=A0AAP0BTC0_9ASPA